MYELTGLAASPSLPGVVRSFRGISQPGGGGGGEGVNNMQGKASPVLTVRNSHWLCYMCTFTGWGGGGGGGKMLLGNRLSGH